MKIERKREIMEVVEADVSGSSYRDVNLSDSRFQDVNMSRVNLSQANLAGATSDDSAMPGARFHNMNLNGASFDDVDTNHVIIENASVDIRNCKIDGMSIDGVPVADMMAAYRAAAGRD